MICAVTSCTEPGVNRVGRPLNGTTRDVSCAEAQKADKTQPMIESSRHQRHGLRVPRPCSLGFCMTIFSLCHSPAQLGGFPLTRSRRRKRVTHPLESFRCLAYPSARRHAPPLVPGPAMDWPRAYVSTGGQVHIRLRSPNGLLIRATDGQNLLARSHSAGKAAFSRLYG